MEVALNNILIGFTFLLISKQMIYGLQTASLTNILIEDENNNISSTNSSAYNETRDNLLEIPQSDSSFPWPAMNMDQPFQEVDLGSQSSFRLQSHCATIYTISYCILKVPDTGIHTDISSEQFIIYTANVMDQCLLTTVDTHGAYTSTDARLQRRFTWTVTNSVCCECNGCQRNTFPKNDNLCAILYENRDCSVCQGFRLEVYDGDEVAVMNYYVNDKVSSIFVAPGCELSLYKHLHFIGEESGAAGAFNLPFEWNDVVSSYKCSCSEKATKRTATTLQSPTMTEQMTNIPEVKVTTTKVISSTTTPTTIEESTIPLPSTKEPEMPTTTIAKTTNVPIITTFMTPTPEIEPEPATTTTIHTTTNLPEIIISTSKALPSTTTTTTTTESPITTTTEGHPIY